jgi:N-acetylneuraminic acid mutarotase
MLEAMLSGRSAPGWVPDPDGNSWTGLPWGWTLLGQGPNNTPGYGNCFDAYAGKLYTFSGDLKAELWEGDEATLAWTKKPDAPLAKDYAAACFCKGMFYVHGGYDTAGGNTTNNVMRRYNPANGSWSNINATGPTKRAQHSMVSLNDKIYLYGGYGNTSTDKLLDLWCYDPSTNLWTRLTDAPFARTEFGMAALNGKIYLYGGMQGTSGAAIVAGFTEYNPTTDRWTYLPSPPPGRYQCTLTAVRGKLYLFGGSSAGGYLNDLWEYNPATAEWTQLMDTGGPSGRRMHHATAQQNKLVVYGGYTGAVNREVWVYAPAIAGEVSPTAPFQGEVLATNLITGSALATAVGLSDGTLMNDTTPWLKFIIDGKTLYMPKKAIRNNVAWAALDALGCVFGTKVITIAGKQYKVRLMTGSTADPGTVGGGEYDNLYARVTTYYTGIRWASYTAADVGWTGTNGNGDMTLVQEVYAVSGGHIARGYSGFMGVWYQPNNDINTGHGWRPILELVP